MRQKRTLLDRNNQILMIRHQRSCWHDYRLPSNTTCQILPECTSDFWVVSRWWLYWTYNEKKPKDYYLFLHEKWKWTIVFLIICICLPHQSTKIFLLSWKLLKPHLLSSTFNAASISSWEGIHHRRVYEGERPVLMSSETGSSQSRECVRRCRPNSLHYGFMKHPLQCVQFSCLLQKLLLRNSGPPFNRIKP